MTEHFMGCALDIEERKYSLNPLSKNSSFCASQSPASFFRSEGTF